MKRTVGGNPRALERAPAAAWTLPFERVEDELRLRESCLRLQDIGHGRDAGGVAAVGDVEGGLALA